MTVFQAIAIILTVAATGGYLNYKFFKLPDTVGHMVFALALSLVLIILGHLGFIDIAAVQTFVGDIDFPELLLHGMLAVLLFAGALHINLEELRNVKITVITLATVGVFISTIITGFLTFYAAQLVGIDLPLIYAMLFGALISPTDPIAVLAILKKAGASKSLYNKIGGESLFNDGVGVLLFITLLALAKNPDSISVRFFLETFFQEAVGGLLFGGVLGWFVYQLIKSINHDEIDILLTLALVAGGYALAEFIHVSAPIAMVSAGLIIGNHGRNFGMTEEARQRLDVFWELLDDIFNAVLFLLMGLVLVIIPVSEMTVILGLLAILTVLAGRFISVGIPITFIRQWRNFDKGTIRLMTWGGLRGGISIALALSIPEGPAQKIILPVTYTVVLFSILVQGLTFRKVVDHVQSKGGV